LVGADLSYDVATCRIPQADLHSAKVPVYTQKSFAAVGHTQFADAFSKRALDGPGVSTPHAHAVFWRLSDNSLAILDKGPGESGIRVYR
jgi:hypothetical protein